MGRLRRRGRVLPRGDGLVLFQAMLELVLALVCLLLAVTRRFFSISMTGMTR